MKNQIDPTAAVLSTVPHDFVQSSGNRLGKIFSAKPFFTVIIVYEISFGRNPVNGTRDSCPNSAVVDLTGETPDSSGAVNKLGLIFPREAVQYDHNGRFGCVCDVRKCLPLCCPIDDAASSNGCVEDRYKTIFADLKGILEADGYHLFIDDPCRLSFMENTTMKKYNLLRDATLDGVFRKYCILREVNSTEYLIGTCLDKKSFFGFLFYNYGNSWSFACDIVRIFFILLTSMVYSVTPELKNFRGLLLRCYLGSTLTYYTLHWAVPAIYIAGSTLAYIILLWVTGLATIYLGHASIFWLTVLNFDVWWKFRRFRPNRHTNVKEYENTMFLRYSIFAWGGSIIFTSIALGSLIWFDLADPLTESTFHHIDLTIMCTIKSSYVICVFFSIFTFTSTALTIRRQEKEIARAVNDVDRNREDRTNEQRITLYLGLFILMGCFNVLGIVEVFWDHPIYNKFCDALGALHGLFTFFIFVWKDDVKRSFRIQVIKILRKWGACRQPHATPDIENENENL